MCFTNDTKIVETTESGKRVKAACTNCKKAKARCDGMTPCRRCVVRGCSDCVRAFPKRIGRRRNHFFKAIVTKDQVVGMGSSSPMKPKKPKRPRKRRTRKRTSQPSIAVSKNAPKRTRNDRVQLLPAVNLANMWASASVPQLFVGTKANLPLPPPPSPVKELSMDIFTAPTFTAPTFTAPTFTAPTFTAPTFTAPTLLPIIAPPMDANGNEFKLEDLSPQKEFFKFDDFTAPDTEFLQAMLPLQKQEFAPSSANLEEWQMPTDLPTGAHPGSFMEELEEHSSGAEDNFTVAYDPSLDYFLSRNDDLLGDPSLNSGMIEFSDSFTPSLMTN